MASDPNEAGNWRDGGSTRRRPRYGWKPGEVGAAPSHSRTFRFGLGVAALLSAGAFAYLLFFLTRPPRPYFVAVAVDPIDDALRLDTPLDLFGWRSAERFLTSAKNWAGSGKSAAKVASAPNPLPDDDEDTTLRGWLDQFRQYDPVVMYFGTHAGTARIGGDKPEPILFAGRGKPIRIARLVRAIGTSSLRDRRVILLLDPARFRPDPVNGYQWDDFAVAMKSLDESVRACPKLVLISGADEGQRSWESEELGATAFAQSVIRTLDDPEGPTDVRTAASLFDDVTGRLRVWTTNNRQAVQSPFLLPLGDEGTKRAATIRMATRPPSASEWNATPPPSPEALAEWRRLWDERAARLNRTPHPATYTPRLWRRYQELLLRHEAALRAGMSAVERRLADAASAAAKELAQPFKPVFGSFGEFPPSFSQSLAFDVVRDPATATDPTASLLDITRTKGTDLPASAGDADNRPAERHLAVMVNRFYRTILANQPTPDSWQDAITLRVQADRAALGLPVPGGMLAEWQKPAAFSERVWPYIRNIVGTTDERRRDAEDKLFGPDSPRPPVAIREGYETAARLAADVRFAFHVRDAAFAELPYLGRWSVATGQDTDRVTALWKKTHDLAAALASPTEPAKLAADARTLWSDITGLRGRIDAAVQKESGAALQSTWLPKQELLATPLLRPDDRERLLIASRRITYDLLTKPTGPTATNAPTPPAPRTTVAADWVKISAAEVGLPPDSTHSAQVAEKYRQLATLGSDERASRSAVAFEADADSADEPAAVVGRRAWADLFDALARRATEDHWYDENRGRGGAPYFARVADRYRADAARLRKVNVDGQRTEPIGIDSADGNGPLQWTSERRRMLGFNLRVPQGTPRGWAVALPRLAPVGGERDPLRFTPATATRSLVAVTPSPGSLSLELESTSEDETPTRVTGGAGLYFRGQLPEAVRPIDVNRRPELVITDPGPATTSASVAVRADPNQPLPPVVVLLDYSGSMKEGLNGFKLPGPDDSWKDSQSKFNLALRRLEAVLAELPKGTPLKVRLFSARGLGDVDSVVYPERGEPAVADWQGGDVAKLRDLMARLRRYEPAGTTPLIESIVIAARDDFPAKADGPKTLVVLTDGADDSGRPGVAKEERDSLRAVMKNTLTSTGVKLVVVQFALNEADRVVSKELFADLPNLDVPGEVVSADDGETLRRELAAAIWPKLVLTGGTSDGGVKYPPGGWPARPPSPPRGDSSLNGELDPNTLYWSPTLGAGNYTARVAGYPDPPFSTKDFPAVGLSAGDFLSLSLTRSGNTFHLRRELHADAFGRARKAYRADGGWVMSVPSTGVEDAKERATFGAVALVERVPPHRRQPVQTSAENPLRHPTPGALWWLVSPAGTDTPSRPLVGWDGTKTIVSRQYGYPAPAWDVRVENWPRTKSGDFEPATVRVWVSDTPPQAIAQLMATVPGEGSETNVVVGGRLYRVTVEQQAFAGSREPMNCLVVRTEYPEGDPVQLRLASSVAGVRVEHRYYRKANGYTAVFGPWPPPPGGARASFEVVRVASVISDSSVIRLTPPAPHLGRRTDDYRPVPTRVGP